jgi:uncharacterized repeat protein (TIGR01451 family)
VAAPAGVVAAPEPQDPSVPVVAVRVRVPASALAGQDLSYHIIVENVSAAAAHHVLLKNPLPAGAQLVRAEPAPARQTPELQWDLGTLPPGAKQEIVLVLKAAGGADLTNCTRVQFEHGQCVTTRIAGSAPVGEPPLEKKVPEKKVPEKKGEAKLSLSMKGAEKQSIALPAKYVITVNNSGSAPATNVLITNKLPADMDFVSASEGGKFVKEANDVGWLLGTLEPGHSKTVEVVLRARAAGQICNKASAVADGGLKADAEACTLFQAPSAMLLETHDRQDPIPVGGETSYPIVVVNQGGMPADNVRIKALIPDALLLLSARGPAGVEHKLGDKTKDGYQIVLFEALASLAPGAKAEYEVAVRALRAGTVRFQVELTADPLTSGPVREQESTTVFADD